MMVTVARKPGTPDVRTWPRPQEVMNACLRLDLLHAAELVLAELRHLWGADQAVLQAGMV